MKKYYYLEGTQQHGPFDIQELKQKNISKSTLIWYEGIENWSSADRIEELRGLFVSIPPPPPPPVKVEQTSVSSLNYNRYKPETRQSNGNRKLLIVFLLLFVLLILGFILYAPSFSDSGNEGPINEGLAKETYQEKVLTIEEIEKGQPAKFLIAGGNYNKNFWGTKWKIRGTIENRATVASYKDAVIRVYYYTKTKTEIDRKDYVIYENIPPTSTIDFNLKIDANKNAEDINWEVVSAKTD
jgi:hypothetical protein